MLLASHSFNILKPSEGFKKVKQMQKLFDFNPKCHSVEIEWSGQMSSLDYGVLRFSTIDNIEITKKSIFIKDNEECIILNDMVFDIIYNLTIHISLIDKK